MAPTDRREWSSVSEKAAGPTVGTAFKSSNAAIAADGGKHERGRTRAGAQAVRALRRQNGRVTALGDDTGIVGGGRKSSERVN